MTVVNVQHATHERYLNQQTHERYWKSTGMNLSEDDDTPMRCHQPVRYA